MQKLKESEKISRATLLQYFLQYLTFDLEGRDSKELVSRTAGLPLKFDPKAGTICSSNTGIRSSNVCTCTGNGFLLGGLMDFD